MIFRILRFYIFFMGPIHLFASSDQEEKIIDPVYGRKLPVTVITQENHPQAYAWYQSMIQKYPKADLNKYGFVVGQVWAMFPRPYVVSKKTLICCPYYKLNGNFTTEDEWALLHEAG